MPFFCEVMNQIAANHVDNGVRIRWKIVPAVTEVCRPQAAHIHLAFAVCQACVELHEGQTKPSGHRNRDVVPHDMLGADWADKLPDHLAMIAALLNPERRERTRPRAVNRARHNQYRVKKPGEPASTRHHAPATINLHSMNPRAA